jgi:hypothetical protein
LRFDPPVELKTTGEQRHWNGIVCAIQATLPSDSHAPGITALTRPVGSINAKNGARVEALREGSPIDPQRAREFIAELKAAPFRVIARILLGDDHISPCPICSRERSRLSVLDHGGKCYGCGTITVETLYDAVLAGAAEAGAEEDTAGRQPRRRPKPSRKAVRNSTRRVDADGE